MNKQRNPDIDFGFHATVPRSIRTGYKDLTPVQKWLYVCLKDLCGEHGTCYRTVKVLAEETGISTGMISESIPVLHKAGLIHAEKKKRSSGGKEVWHITIVDIWAANGKLHPTKRSHSEQTLENVHTVNDNVHHVNDDSQECSHSEQERSLCETEAVSRSSIISEAVSPEEERENPPAHHDASASAHTPSESSSEQKLQQIIEDKTANGIGSPPAPSKEATNGQEVIQANVPGAHKRPRRPKPEIDAQTQTRIDLVVEALNGMKQEVTGDPEAHYFVSPKDTEAIVEKLLPQSPTPKKLRRVFLDMWNEKDRTGNYFWRKRMKIHNICNEYESRMMGLEGKTSTKPTNEHKATNVENTLEDDPYSISALLARQKRLAAQEA